MLCYMRHVLGLTVCLLLTVDSVVSECCPYCCCFPDTPDKQGQPCGDVYVENDYAFVNSTINITCTLYENTSSVNASDLYFTTCDEDLTCTKIYGDVINSTTVVLQHVVSVNDNGQIFYCEAEGLPSQDVVERVEINTEYFPQTPTNFSCIYYEDFIKLNCSWDHPVKYINSGDISVTFEWSIDGRIFSICPEQNEDRLMTSCGDITNIVHGDRVDFRLNVTNTKKSITTSNTISFAYPYTLRNEYGKPHKMETLTPIQIERTSVKLSWTSNSSAKLFCIKHNTTDGPKTFTTSNKTILIENLTAYTMYQFEVVGFYTDKNQRIGLPSDPAVLLIRTLQDVGKSPPRVMKGGFTTDSRKLSEIRNITIYWQNFEDMNLNGPILKYEVIFNMSGKEIQSRIVDGFDQSQFTLTNIPFSASGHVGVKAGTEVGMSRASSLMHIPRLSDSIKPPELILEILNEDQQIFGMLLSWKPLSQNKATGFTIYWCESTVGCQKHINWINVTAGSSNHNITDLDRSKNYLFGVSMETEDLSSGFTWESCYHKRYVEPNQPQSVQAQKREPTSLHVTWSRPSCDYLSPSIDHYILFWCPADIGEEECAQSENSSRNFLSQNTTSNHYKITDLYPGTRYCIWTKAVTTVGKESLPAEKTCYATLDAVVSKQESKTLLIIVLTMTFAAFIILCVILFRIKKILGTTYAIEVPIIPRNKQEMLRNIHDDSNKSKSIQLLPNKMMMYSDGQRIFRNEHTLLEHNNASLDLSCLENIAEQFNKTSKSQNENCLTWKGNKSENTSYSENTDYVRVGIVSAENEFSEQTPFDNTNQESGYKLTRPIESSVPLFNHTNLNEPCVRIDIHIMSSEHSNQLPYSESAMLSSRNEESAMLSTRNEDSVISSSRNEESALSSSRNKESAMLSSRNEESEMSSTSNEDSVISSSRNEKSAISSLWNEESAMSSSRNEEYVISSSKHEKSAILSSRNERSAMSSSRNEESSMSSSGNEKSVISSSRNEESSMSSSGNQKSVISSSRNEESSSENVFNKLESFAISLWDIESAGDMHIFKYERNLPAEHSFSRNKKRLSDEDCNVENDCNIENECLPYGIKTRRYRSQIGIIGDNGYVTPCKLLPNLIYNRASSGINIFDEISIISKSDNSISDSSSSISVSKNVLAPVESLNEKSNVLISDVDRVKCIVDSVAVPTVSSYMSHPSEITAEDSTLSLFPNSQSKTEVSGIYLTQQNISGNQYIYLDNLLNLTNATNNRENCSTSHTDTSNTNDGENCSTSHTDTSNTNDGENCSISHTDTSNTNDGENCSTSHTDTSNTNDGENCSTSHADTSNTNDGENCSISHKYTSNTNDGENCSTSHTDTSNTNDGENCSTSHTDTSNTNDGENCSTSHKYTSNTNDGENCSISHTDTSNTNDGENCSTSHTDTSNTNDGENCSTSHKYTSNTNDGENCSISHTDTSNTNDGENCSTSHTDTSNTNDGENCSTSHTDTSNTNDGENCSISHTDTSNTNDGENCSTSHTDTSNTNDGENCSTSHKYTSNTNDGENCSISHTDTSNTNDGENCSSSHTDTSNTNDGENCSTSHTDTSNTNDGENCSTSHTDTSNINDGENCSSSHTDTSNTNDRENCSTSHTDTSNTNDGENCSTSHTDTSNTNDGENCSTSHTDTSNNNDGENCSTSHTDTSNTNDGENCSTSHTDTSNTNDGENCSSSHTDTSNTNDGENCSSSHTDTSNTNDGENCSTFHTDTSNTNDGENCSTSHTDTGYISEREDDTG